MKDGQWSSSCDIQGGRWCNVYSKTGERRSKGRPSASGQQGRLKKKMDSLRGRSIVHPSDGERRRECLAVLRGSALASRTGGDIVTPFASTASLSPNGDRRWQVPQLTLCDGQQTRGQKRATPAAFHVTWLVPTSDRGHALCVDSRSGLGGSDSSVARVVVDSGPRMASQNAGIGSFPLGLHPATGVEQVDYRCVSLVGRSVSTTVCKVPWVTLPTTTCDDVNAV